jgi:hypothetical protein
MAQRVHSFDNASPVRRYDWTNWTDGSIWEIRRGEDYDVPTENMRVNLHERAKQQGLKVRTQIVRKSPSLEGLRFQFYVPEQPPVRSQTRARMRPIGDPRSYGNA